MSTTSLFVIAAIGLVLIVACYRFGIYAALVAWNRPIGRTFISILICFVAAFFVGAIVQSGAVILHAGADDEADAAVAIETAQRDPLASIPKFDRLIADEQRKGAKANQTLLKAFERDRAQAIWDAAPPTERARIDSLRATGKAFWLFAQIDSTGAVRIGFTWGATSPDPKPSRRGS